MLHTHIFTRLTLNSPLGWSIYPKPPRSYAPARRRTARSGGETGELTDVLQPRPDKTYSPRCLWLQPRCREQRTGGKPVWSLYTPRRSTGTDVRVNGTSLRLKPTPCILQVPDPFCGSGSSGPRRPPAPPFCSAPRVGNTWTVWSDPAGSPSARTLSSCSSNSRTGTKSPQRITWDQTPSWVRKWPVTPSLTFTLL